MNTLLLTSCNRIKQVLLSLSLNSQIIQNKFNVVIVDCSTPDADADSMCATMDMQDPYNKVKPYNYCSDINLLYEAHKYFDNIEDFRVIHHQPRLIKQPGEATLTALGLMQSVLMGSRGCQKENYCLKLTGSSILRYDILSELKLHLKTEDVMIWHRQNIGGEERSTRIFGCKPAILSSYILQEGWSNWCDDVNGIFELRFARFVKKYLPHTTHYTGLDESGALLEGGVSMPENCARERILNFIQEQKIDTKKNPYLVEFMEGGIW